MSRDSGPRPAAIFSLVVTPLLFTGCTYYPWAALGGVRWFQVLTLFNPLTYAAEGLRWAMMPPSRSPLSPQSGRWRPFAERLRQQGADVVLLTGSELSLSTIGFLPSDTIKDRLELLTAPHRLREVIAEVPARINDFLGKAVGVVRERFGGKITATPRSRWRGSTGHPSTSSRPTPAIARSRSPTGIATASVPSSHRGSRWRSPSSGAPPTAAPPIWAAVVTRWSNGATAAGRSG